MMMTKRKGINLGTIFAYYFTLPTTIYSRIDEDRIQSDDEKSEKNEAKDESKDESKEDEEEDGIFLKI